jgi:PAS domain-containing protein
VIPAKFYSAYERELLQSTSINFEVYFSELNIWVEVSTFPSDEGLSLYFKDITRRKHGEEQLQREKEKYLQIFNLSPLPQWVFDTEKMRLISFIKMTKNLCNISSSQPKAWIRSLKRS